MVSGGMEEWHENDYNTFVSLSLLALVSNVVESPDSLSDLFS